MSTSLLGALLPPLPPTIIQYVVATTHSRENTKFVWGIIFRLTQRNSHEDGKHQDATPDANPQSSSRMTSPSRSPTASAPPPIEQTPQQKCNQDNLNKFAQPLADTLALPQLLQQVRLIHVI